MSDLLLARVGGLTKESRLYLTSYGVDFNAMVGGDLLLIELHKLPERLKELEENGYFPVGEAHAWHVERVAADGITILIRISGHPKPIVVPAANIVSIAIAPDTFKVESAVAEASFSKVAKEAVSPRDGVPRLSRQQIEREAENFLLTFGDTRLRLPAPTNFRAIVSNLNKTHGIRFDFATDLGYSVKNKKILGRYQLEKRSIFIDRFLEDRPRFNFTLAHELGHLYLHSNVRLRNSSDILETRNTVNFRQNPSTPLQWIEWQANAFAAGILMPAATVRDAVVVIQKEHSVTNRLGIVFLDEQPWNAVVYREVVRKLRYLYAVSATVASIRLKTLQILQLGTNFEPPHISEFLRTA